MGVFLVYILKSAVCLAMFYLFYRLLLSKETFHRFNRFALLGVLIMSAVLPLVKLTVADPSIMTTSVMTAEDLLLMQVWNQTGMEVVEEGQTIFWQGWMVLIYVVGVFFFLFRNLWSLSRMLYLIRCSRRMKLANGVWLIIHDQKFAPFSWMKFIVLSQTDWEDENGNNILIHEQAHIHNGHSWDLLVVEFCAWLQWFNPAVWLLKQELQNIHEYEADEEVLRQGVDARQYQMLLIKKAVGARLYSIANSFNHSSLKKRITMMIRKKSNPWARTKYLYVLPLAAVAVTAFARPEISESLNEISSVKVNDFSAIMNVAGSEKTFASAEKTQNQQEVGEKVQLKMQVIDKQGAPIVAANVVIVNTSSGTITDENGRFVLEVGDKQKIWVSYVGMKSVTLSVDECLSRKGGIICLESEAQDLSVSSISVKSSEKVKIDEEDFMVVEQMPEYPGGIQECFRFMARNLKYPIEAQKKGIQGRVIVQFTVKKDGSLDDFKVIKSVDPLLDEEALRVIKTMPVWKPGMQRGKTVNVKYSLPIAFDLGGSKNKFGGKEGDQDALHVIGYASMSTGSEAKSSLSVQGGNASLEDSDVFMVVEQMPEYPGGMSECMKFLASNIKYPIEAKEKKIQGRVIVQFVVRKDGSLGNVTVLRSIDPLLDAEAIRVVGLMPKWKPGMQRGQAVNVKFTIPVTFRLDNKKGEEKEVAVNAQGVSFIKSEALVKVDGIEVDQEYLKKLSPEKIESVSVLKDVAALSEFGEKGKNGVILITTKKNSSFKD